MRAICLGAVLGLAVSGYAHADITSTRPKPRPDVGQVAPVSVAPASVEAGLGPARSIRPKQRPSDEQMTTPTPEAAPDQVASAPASPKKGILERMFGPKKKPKTAPSAPVAGSVCNDPAILGTAIPTIQGKLKGCGIENPVRITEVDGVRLSTPATLDCSAARALRLWVTTKLQPAFKGDPVRGLRVAAHYACRGRNNKKGARISEHGRGKAIDISGFMLASGRELTVLKDYRGKKGKPIRAAHKGACGIFGTTLGPGSDGYHENHLHFDTAKYRGGSYCR